MSTNKLFRASKDFVKQSDEHCLVLYLNNSAVDNIWIKADMENEDLFAHLNAALVVTTSDREISGLRCEGFSNPHSHALRLYNYW